MPLTLIPTNQNTNLPKINLLGNTGPSRIEPRFTQSRRYSCLALVPQKYNPNKYSKNLDGRRSWRVAVDCKSIA